MNGVVFFLVGLNSGGIENYLLRYLTDNSQKFKEVIVFCKGGVGGALEKKYMSINNVSIVKYNVGNYHIHHYLKLTYWLIKYKDYTVCDFTGNFAAPVILAAKIVGINKRIVFYRSSTNRFKENFIKLTVNKIYKNIIKKYATKILSNSHYAFDFFYGEDYIDNRMQVIYNGVNVDKFLSEKDNILNELNSTPDEIIIGHVGRYNPAKNHRTIVKVAEILINKGYKVHFLLCGKDVPLNLSMILKNKSIDDRFTLFDNRSDIPKILNTIDIFYFPSVTEGQPNALIEAWIKGIPFITSNIPPIENITPNSFKENLVKPFNIAEQEKLLVELINKPWTNKKKKSLHEYAIKEFDSIKRFGEFSSVLIDK